MNIGKEFMDSLPVGVKQTGNESKESDQLLLKAGKLRILYNSGTLRYVATDHNELIRMIYSAVRDKNWLTTRPLIENEHIESSEDSFRITLKCVYREGEINFSASYLIEGNSSNTITFTMDGIALDTFEKNRIGLCVLHPVEGFAGENCVIVHTDGSTEQSVFPEEISPYQVFRDIKSMIWLTNRIHCRIDFEGDVFETEDQRNWTDTSFKTYSTPLSLPYPVTVEKDTRIYQKIVFRAEGHFGSETGTVDKTIIKLFPEETFRIPSVGICRSDRPYPLTNNEIKLLRSIRFDHYRIDLHLYDNEWQTKAEQAVSESSDLGYPVEFALFFDDDTNHQINSFIKWYSERMPAVYAILLFHKSHASTPELLARNVIPLLRATDPEVKIVTGTNANFAQINRDRPGETGNDSICYSIQPQEHASDNTTLVENLKAQEYSVRSARSFAGNKGIMISPVNIKRRFNANNTYVELPWSGTDLPPQVDNRIMSLFGACWTAGSLKYLCEAGADSITYFETVGERGIIQGDRDSKWPLYFQSVKRMIFPVYHVFRFLLANKSLTGIKSASSKPLISECLALSDGKQARLLLVNFTGSGQPVSLDCCSGLFRIRTLSSHSFAEAASNQRWSGIEQEKIIKSQNTFEIEPYSINFIEGWRKH